MRSCRSFRPPRPPRLNVAAGLVVLLTFATATLAEPLPLEADLSQPPAAASGESMESYLRVTRDAEGRPLALQTAVVRFAPGEVPDEGPFVDLVSVVHVAEADYYQALNEEFSRYDAVLYELVAPEEARVPSAGASAGHHPVSALQLGMTRMLELTYQLDGIDYTAENLVHADMTPEQFAASMRDRGESFLAMFARMFGHAMAQQSGGGADDARLMAALFSRQRALRLRQVLADQFEGTQGVLDALEGPDGGTLIAGRNEVAVEVLREKLEAGKEKLAIFYGAGHMPDFAERLRDEFDMLPIRTRWMTAWGLAHLDPAEQRAAEEAAASAAEGEPEEEAALTP